VDFKVLDYRQHLSKGEEVNKSELITFERDIVKLFEAKRIKAPVHLSGGNEDSLIKIFKQIKPSDWVCSTHRSHYHALLKGVPPELVKSEILKGHSITLNFSRYKFITSAIVGGILPIAVGLAMAGERVWCFCGDMASCTGVFHECVSYSTSHKLPITFVTEDNGVSVNTPTKQVMKYSYKRKYPHQGTHAGFISF
jgi:TPP-dependent pyruvate/acetoin dehydrogenase alpha subunit